MGSRKAGLKRRRRLEKRRRLFRRMSNLDMIQLRCSCCNETIDIIEHRRTGIRQMEILAPDSVQISYQKFKRLTNGM